MGNQQHYSPIMNAYMRSQMMQPLFQIEAKQGQFPLTFQDSLTSSPNYPYSAFGLLKAEGKHGTQKGIAFVVADNYLLTCASNCYSHLHKQYYKLLTFTIHSNRKAGIETIHITKAFVPQLYKELPENLRDKFNFALLFVEGELKLKDKYGSIGLAFNSTHEDPLIYSEWALSNQQKIQMVASRKMQEKVSILLSGTPLIHSICGYFDIVEGLVFQTGREPSFLLFTKEVHSQLAQWAQIENGYLNLKQIDSEFLFKDLAKLKVKKPIPIQTIDIPKILQGQKCKQILEVLPFSSISQINLSKRQIEDSHIIFINMKKFRNIKVLNLDGNKIGPLGCKYIADAALSDLRLLSLTENKILAEGCQYLSKADWPFLQSLSLGSCFIGNKGMQALAQSVRRNLLTLYVKDININNQGLIYLQSSEFPRLSSLFFIGTSIDYIGLSYFKSSVWNSLKNMNLSLSNIGTAGCKMIKEANLTLSTLTLNRCKIDQMGMKWLCKGNLSKLYNLQLIHNKVGDEGCYHLSKASLPLLLELNLKETQFSMIGLRWLLKTEWRESVFVHVIQKYRQFSWRQPDKEIVDLFIGRLSEAYFES